MRIIGRIITCIWFGFWAFFGIASGIGEGGSNLIFHLIFPTLIFAAVLLIVWRWEAVGSILLIILGLIFAIGYPLITNRNFPIATIIFVELSLALPPLLAGLLLLAARRKSRLNATANPSAG